MIETEWSDTPIKDIPAEHSDEALATDFTMHLHAMLSYMSSRGVIDQDSLDALLNEAGEILNGIVDADEDSTPREAYPTTRILDVITLGLLQRRHLEATLSKLPNDMGELLRDHFGGFNPDAPLRPSTAE